MVSGFHSSPTTTRPARVAIVGSGIAGLAAAHTLQGLADITLFEAGDHFGGHTHTVDVTLPDAQGVATTLGVDTGFLVLNERIAPNLLALLAALEVPIAPSDMSFSVQVPGAGPGGHTLEWSGSNLSSVFSQRRNLANPRFLRMLADIARFNRVVTRLAERGEDLRPGSPLLQPVGDFLRAQRFSTEFRDWYFLPLMGGLWSGPTDQMLVCPVTTLVRFCHHHGLIPMGNRPQWYTVAGGARQYVHKIIERIADKRLSTPVQQVLRDEQGVRVISPGHVERFDAIVMACHSDQSLRLLGSEASAGEREVLGAIRYQPTRAVLHTDASVLPENPRAWAAWNCERAAAGAGAEPAQACLHALINRLQPLPVERPLVVSLNPRREIHPTQVLGEYACEHPVFDLAAIRAQAQVPALQGRHHTWFAGAWTGHGFHEDGLKSGLQAARMLIDAHGLAPVASESELRRAALPGVFA
jgi:predicted NAD/FAD-binding protein